MRGECDQPRFEIVVRLTIHFGIRQAARDRPRIEAKQIDARRKHGLGAVDVRLVSGVVYQIFRVDGLDTKRKPERPVNKANQANDAPSACT